MCTNGCIEFARTHLSRTDVSGKPVLEVGSCDVNGTIRRLVESLGPAKYVGVDIVSGPGVDLICPAEKLVERFGNESFDVVVTTEMLEHVRDWRTVIHNLKNVLRPGGILLITTRSRGFHFHGYPADFWRYEVSDISRILADMTLESVESDSSDSPGVFVRARRPENFTEQATADIRLYSAVRHRRTHSATLPDVIVSRGLSRAKSAACRWLPLSLQRGARRGFDSLASGFGVRPGR
nr:class I SAM-dependent methyltransferase [Streptomyces antibioticus]